MIDKNGTYKARAAEVLLINSKDKGTPGIQVNFRVTEGEFDGQTVRWDGWLTEKTAERTIESLQICGWEGEDLADFTDRQLHGLDLNEVELVVELEPYQGDDEKHKGKSFPRVRWVNEIGRRGLNVAQAMKPDEAAAFSEKLKGLVVKSKLARTKATEAGADDSFNFGANAKQPPAQAAAGGRKF